MNDRLKELARRADITLDYLGYGTDLDGGNPNIEKFAELIIEECAKLIDSAEDAVVIYSTKTGEEISKGNMLRQYFRVK